MAERTIVNLNTGKDGAWFDFFYSELNPDTMDIEYGEPIEGGPRARIRNPAPFFQERARRRKTESKMVFNKKARKMENVTFEKELTPEEKKAENDDMVDFVIQEVDGFKIDGREMNNTRKDKLAAMEIPIFAMFINRCIELSQKQGAIEEKAEAKNLSSGSSSKKSKLTGE